SIDAPGWALDFRLPSGGAVILADFVRAHAGRAEFAECVAGSFLGQPVRLVQDSEFADRLWLRGAADGPPAEVPLIGEVPEWFAAAVAEVAGTVGQDAEPVAAPDPAA